MTLNIKAAMAICFAFIGGVTWVAQRGQPPASDVVSPLVVAGPSAGLGSLSTLETDEFGRPLNWVGRFRRPSPLEQEAAQNRNAHGTLTLVAPPPAIVDQPESVRLPPLVRTSERPQVDAAEVVFLDAAGNMAESVPASDYVELSSRASEASHGDVPGPDVADEILAVRPASSGRVAGAIEVAAAEEHRGSVERVSDTPKPRTYAVRSGDTLTSVSRKVMKSDDRAGVDALLKLNPQLAARRGRLVSGETLKLPASKEGARPASKSLSAVTANKPGPQNPPKSERTAAKKKAPTGRESVGKSDTRSASPDRSKRRKSQRSRPTNEGRGRLVAAAPAAAR